MLYVERIDSIKEQKSQTYQERFRIARNKCNNLVSSAKIAHYSKVSENIRLEKAGSKNWWTLVKSLTRNNDCSRNIPPIEHNGNLVIDDIEKSELFNNFCEQSTLDDSDHTPPDLTELQSDGLRQILITETEVEDILKNLETSKATSPDCINPRLLREAAPILKYPLYKLFNISLSLSSFPSEWKLATVTPVFEKDSPGILKNYRPISLISIVGKVMERCVNKHIYNFLLENRIISSNQSGFTPGDSAINQLLYITNEFGKALDDGKEDRVVFCDVSKAFDRVWHKGFLTKLK